MRNVTIFRGPSVPESLLGNTGNYYFQEHATAIVIWRKINNSSWTPLGATGSGGVGAIIHGTGAPDTVIVEPLEGMHYINDANKDFWWYSGAWILIANLEGSPGIEYQSDDPDVVPPGALIDGMTVINVQNLSVWNLIGVTWVKVGYLDREAVALGVGTPVSVPNQYSGMLYIDYVASTLYSFDGTDWNFVTQLGIKILHDVDDPEAEAPEGTHFVNDTTKGFWWYSGGWQFIGFIGGVSYQKNGVAIGSSQTKVLNILVANPDSFVATDAETLTLDLTSAQIDGFVTITNITAQSPSDNVAVTNRTPDDYEVLDATSSTQHIRVHVLAVTGTDSFQPTVLVDGTQATLTRNSGTDVWQGFADITTSSPMVTATHNEGSTHSVNMTYVLPPVVTVAEFRDTYPVVDQTEYAAGRSLSVHIEADTPFVQVEFVADIGSANTYLLSPVFGATLTTDISVTSADRGNVTTDFPTKVRVKSDLGTWSEVALSTLTGNVDGTNTVKLNNTRATATFGAKVYANGFSALKGVETATVAMTYANADTFLFDSPTSELVVTDPTDGGTSKTVTRASGGYNITAPNLRVVVGRIANDTTATFQTVVNIADTTPTVSIATATARLRSGGRAGTTAQEHTITITASQRLYNAPSVAASIGLLHGGWATSDSGVTWTQLLRIHDDDAKGSALFSALSATNLAGKPIVTFTGSAAYTVGGFVKRVISFAVYQAPDFNREADIGTKVALLSKLEATNLSKGASSTYNVSHSPTRVDDSLSGPFTYTVTGPTGVSNPNGDTVYNNDSVNAAGNNNPIALVQFEIEEKV